MSYKDHYVVRFANEFYKYASSGKIPNVLDADIMILAHVLSTAISDYSKLKLLDKVLSKYMKLLLNYDIKYVPLRDFEKYTNPTKNISKCKLRVVGNIIELYIPFLLHSDMQRLTAKLEELDLAYDSKYGNWFTEITNPKIFEEIENIDVIKKIGIEYLNIEQKDKILSTLTETIQREQKLLELSFTGDLDVDIHNNPEAESIYNKMFEFQRVIGEYSKHRNSILLADEMGLGKSVQGLFVMSLYNLFPALIVCPASLRNNWKAEIKKWLPNRKTHIVMGNIIPPKIDIFIISYNMLSSFASRLITRGIKLVILDESQYIKTESSQRTRSVLHWTKNIKYKISMTGTPIENRLSEIVPQLEFLGVLDTQFGGKRRFVQKYITGNNNPEDVQLALRKTCMLRRYKRDVASQLPKKRKQIVFLDVSNKIAYQQVERDSIYWYKQKLDDSGISDEEKLKLLETKLQNRNVYSEMLVKLNALKQAAAYYKMPSAFEWIDNLLEQTIDSKVCIYAHHRNILEAIHERYKDRSVLLYGDNSSNSGAILDKFCDDPAIDIFVGSITAAGTGLNRLQEVSNIMVQVELMWNPSKHWQVEDRLHRFGQLKDETINYYLIASETIEMYIYNILLGKEDIFNKTLDQSLIIKNIFEQLARENK